MIKLCIFVMALLLTGCATTGEHSLLGWFFGRKAREEQKVEARAQVVEDRAVTAAQVEIRKTAVALAAAAEEQPASRPVQVAQRTNGNAETILTQRAPLSVGAADEAVRIARDLLSAEVAKREAAEKSQSGAEQANRELGRQLEELRAQLVTLAKERAAEAANNLRLANELRAATIWKWIGTAGTALMTLAALAYRYNLGGLQKGVADGLAGLQHKFGGSDEDLAAVKAAIDAATLPATQNQLFNLVAKAMASKTK